MIILPAVIWKNKDPKQRYTEEIQKEYQQQLEWFMKDHNSEYTSWHLHRGLLSNAKRRVLYTIPPKNSTIEELLKFADHEVLSYCKVNDILL